MFDRILRGIRSAFGQFYNFLTALFWTPAQPSGRDSTAAERAKAAKQVGDAMNIGGHPGGGGISGGVAADGLFGEALAGGHKKGRKPPPPQAR